METEGLSGSISAPPPALERAIAFTVPPSAREAVMGDLREVYRSPRQYAAEAFRTVPHVVLSALLRVLNIPLLILQGGLFFFGLKDLSGLGDFDFNPARSLTLTGLLLLLLLIREAWRPAGRPAAGRAIREAIAIGVFMLVFCPMALGMRQAYQDTPDMLAEFEILTVLPLAVPLFGILRSLLIVQGDRTLGDFREQAGELADDYRRYLAGLRRRHLWEAGALLGAALSLAWIWHMSVWLPGLFLLTALFLFAMGSIAPTMPADSQALRAQYRLRLLQEQLLQGFLWWLWASPFLILFYKDFLAAGLAVHRTLLVAEGSAVLILIAFLVGALNQEDCGRTEEKIALLQRR